MDICGLDSISTIDTDSPIMNVLSFTSEDTYSTEVRTFPSTKRSLIIV
jgi:hypothetical protein